MPRSSQGPRHHPVACAIQAAHRAAPHALPGPGRARSGSPVSGGTQDHRNSTYEKRRWRAFGGAEARWRCSRHGSWYGADHRGALNRAPWRRWWEARPYAACVRPFWYCGYATPWFDGTHTPLHGVSIMSKVSMERPSFRSLDTADKRHISAGIRLCRQPYPLH